MLKLFMGFRKFITIVIVIATAITFRLLNYVNGSEFVDLLKGCVIAYMATNIGSHLVSAIKDKLAKKA